MVKNLVRNKIARLSGKMVRDVCPISSEQDNWHRRILFHTKKQEIQLIWFLVRVEVNTTVLLVSFSLCTFKVRSPTNLHDRNGHS